LAARRPGWIPSQSNLSRTKGVGKDKAVHMKLILHYFIAAIGIIIV